MKLIGRFFDTIEWTNYYVNILDDKKEFYYRPANNKDDYEMEINIEDDRLKHSSAEEMSNFALCLNSPWSLTTFNYHIKFNEKLSSWICVYSVVGCEGIYTECYGYGITPSDTLNDCSEMFSLLQTKYNPRNEAF